MDVIGPPATFREHVVPRLVVPGAELILDALPDLDGVRRVLEVSAGTGTLTAALAEKLAGSAPLTVLAREDLAALPAVGEGVRFLRAGAERLPFRDACFDVVVANLALGARAYDAARVAAMRRALEPGGVLVLSALLGGSFDEIFDVLTEVAEHTPDARLLAGASDARRELYDPRELEALLRDQGLVVEAAGEQERALFYESGAAAAADPLLFDCLAESWLGSAPSEEVRREAARFLDTYLGGGAHAPEPFAVRVKTAVLRARLPRDAPAA